MSPSLEAYFREYDQSHATRGNELCHFVGIPLIMVSLLGLLSQLVIGQPEFFHSPLFRLDAGSLLWFFAVSWYLVLDLRIGFSFSFFALGAYFVGRTIPLAPLVVMFVIGWIFQFVGHGVYEKKSPAFFTNLKQILIGPLWVFTRILKASV